MEQILELLKSQPKEVLQWIILELMRDDKLSFADIAQLQVEYLEKSKTQKEKIQAFYNWLGEHEHLFEQEHDEDSAYLVASIKSMYKDIFNLDGEN